MRPRLIPLIALACIAAIPASSAPLKFDACHIPKLHMPMRCAVFQVPENRHITGGRILGLHVVWIPARKHPAKKPIFFISGGPGQAATASAPYITPDAWQLQEHDVVLMDVRGTTEGNKLDCDLAGSDANIQEYLEPLFHNGARYGECAAQLSKRADLRQYTTPNSMQDLDDLRQAMGYTTINIDAGSYGTRAALTYMHMFPTRVHSAVLSGVVTMSNRSPLYHAAAAERAAETLFEQCAADAACHKAFPNPKADLDAILITLKAHPASVTVKHPATGKPTAIALTASGFSSGLRVMLYDEDAGRTVPLLLKQARAGDYTPFAEAALDSGRGIAGSLTAGLLLSVDCTEDTDRIRADEVTKETAGSFIGEYRVRGQMAACAVWPKTQLWPDYFKPFTANVPVLLISGNLDPVTPPHWGDEEHRLLPNSLHVVMPGAHVAQNDCVDKMSKALMDTGSLKTVDASCAKATKLPPWVLPKS